MIEPYSASIRSVLPRLAALGFVLAKDDDYAMSFSNGEVSIIFSTERYYHPSIGICLRTSGKMEYELGTVRRIVAPESSASHLDALNRIRGEYGLDKTSTDRSLRDQGIAEYVRLAVEQMAEFLEQHKDILHSQESFKAEYDARERALLAGKPLP